ncbi:septal ring lytic transglycosylase RlpA family protein [Alteromonas sediminis]|uniref:Endolytic peptidoglycan transglycosylase RlpA n=1 Tax=Alteromonas sediminis TaxID=2259342 RepID=A0A3N5YAW3_9ALTE|nr:septal ring lytic transglycosylase RlpA family protein [Alteromonas sediminis]RPJ68779.1 septal ring lytic transglycosylase RlpA family protein [Alteromonas sediminis]
MRAITRIFFYLAITAIVGGCAQSPSGRYAQKQDSAPQFNYAEPEMRDATPRYEPYREHNNRPYTVLGKQYFPMSSGKGFEQIGYASWYGQKFHGHLTSNGETYDMFAMSAAHTTLPLPSFVKVTNLENNRTAIVRVNDRGPFHDDRIIDLSYAAAKKLDTMKNGVAKVKIEVIHVSPEGLYTVGKGPTQSFEEYAGIVPPTTEPEKSEGIYIQVAALSDKHNAKALSDGLASLYQVPTALPFVDNLFRLRLGPFQDRFQVSQLLSDLQRNGYPGAYIIGL